MADRTKPADIAVDGNIVGRVGEYQVSGLATHQARDIVLQPGITTQ